MNRIPLFRLGRGALACALLTAIAACGGGGADDEETTSQAAADEGLAQTAAAEESGSVSALAGASPALGTLQLVTRLPNGAAATASSSTCAISADGGLVLFSSDASNLVAGDTNGTSDLFLKNLHTGALTRVTTQSNGAQLAAGGNCLASGMTPDGRVVAFNSNNAVFVKNTQTGLLSQASPPAGTVPQVEGFFGGAISDDGNKVVLLTLPQTTYAGAYQFINVVPARLMLRDMSNGSLVTLATDNGVVAQGEIVATRFAISPDGTRVAFVSSSASLVAGDTNGKADVFVRNLLNGSTVIATSTSDGVPAVTTVCCSAFYWNPSFVSNTQLSFGTGQPGSLGETGLYLKDLSSGALALVLSNVDGGADAVLSGNGRKVAFGQLYGSGFDRRVFVRDRTTGQQTLASASSSGVASNGNAGGAVISRDGTRVAFGSNARNLITPRPPANVFQIYAKVVATAAAQQ